MRASNRKVSLTDAIPGSVAISSLKPLVWSVRQRILRGLAQDNAQNPAWLRIDNPGARVGVDVRLSWADPKWPHYRRYGYQKIGGRYTVLRGEAAAAHTRYLFEIPHGVSWFGAFPWYSNEDAGRFLAVASGHPLCQVRCLGQTAQGRDLRCLTIAPARRGRRKPNIAVLARTHANESSGSFAVEGIADYLLHASAAREILRKYTVHLFPNVNPDGIAAGIKLTRIAPDQYQEFNMAVSGMSSPDLTMLALREEIRALRPACLLDYHSYLSNIPMLGFLDKRVGARLYEAVFDAGDPEGCRYYVVLWREMYPGTSIVDYCQKRFNSTIVLPELPWNFGRLPAEIRTAGLKIFLGAVHAHAKR